MSKRKGLSVDEKRIKMLEIFHESKDFYQLKELEKIAPKEKGIIVQSVKDIVQGLVDDGLVDSDKIGTSVYYWSYPSKALNAKKRKLDELNTKTEEVTKKLKETEKQVETEKVGKDDSEERGIIIQELEALTKKEDELRKKLQQYKDNDPELYEKMNSDIKVIVEAANRWTDNIFAVKSWCKRKFNIEENLLDKQFEIPSDFDYVTV
ncbi:meiotic nuclear division protein 1 homolog [Planococcus citri]|uniref:meiotic nuclear division protein 1 homolog n=1 Tax=Planococcus citri TaxID=170843 RepID=UPI0031F97EA9